jgi:predicted unusual protein kinase regulating ubiquinone biosynthesis (AarF/ABC1/UbiB family)
MATKWDELAGERGADIPQSRWARMLRLGGLGVKVSASAVAHKLAGTVKTPEARLRSIESLHRRNADRIVQVLGRLKGASMKIGQILSADPDLLPPEYLDTLSLLQRNAPPMTWATVKQQLEAALDRPIDAVFSYFDPDPIGSASIGQVHRGQLKTGEKVAVKVQYPGIVASLDADLKNLGSVLQFTRVLIDKKRVDEYLDECRSAIREEADYVTEAHNMRRLHEPLNGRPGIRAPRPFEQWTRPSVLMMELAEGEKLDEALGRNDDPARKTRLLGRWVELYSWMFHELLSMHADPHPGNFLLDADDHITILDFGCVKDFDPAFADGILDILDACWQNDDARAARTYQRLGFGKDGANSAIFDPGLLRRYHEIVLEPFLSDVEFEFGSWRPRAAIQRFVLENPRFLKLTPPAEALMYFRVLSGIKGLLAKLDVRLNVYRMAVATARRRGRLTSEVGP